jgi:ATP-dependent RNA helicase DDX56/DBP9
VLGASGAGGEESGEAGAEEERRMQPAPLQFNFKELESFRYRVEDTLRSVTVTAVKELRSAELKREILNSERLKSFFAENPNDLKVLRHDKAIAHPIRQKDHLKSVPEYLMPISMRGVSNVKKNSKRGKKRKMAPGSGSSEQRVAQSKKRNPLYSADSAGDADGGDGGAEGGDGDAGNAEGDFEPATAGDSADAGGMSGRKEWKMRHKKGTFNPKAAKKNEHRTPGSFIKSKKYK